MIYHTARHHTPFQIDEADAHLLDGHTWRVSHGYIVTNVNKPTGGITKLYLHVHIMGPAPDGFEWNHRNTNRLDNRRGNLVPVTHAANIANGKLPKNNTSGHKGVCAFRGKWQAAIVRKRVRYNLGTFATKEEAIAARKTAELKL